MGNVGHYPAGKTDGFPVEYTWMNLDNSRVFLCLSETPIHVDLARGIHENYPRDFNQIIFITTWIYEGIHVYFKRENSSFQPQDIIGQHFVHSVTLSIWSNFEH